MKARFLKTFVCALSMQLFAVNSTSAANWQGFFIPPTLRNSDRGQTIKSFTEENSAQENALTIRGTNIPLPFKIRVQVKEISSFSNEASRGFEISGKELVADGYRSLGKKSPLSCSIYRNPMALLNTSPFDPFPSGNFSPSSCGNARPSPKRRTSVKSCSSTSAPSVD